MDGLMEALKITRGYAKNRAFRMEPGPRTHHENPCWVRDNLIGNGPYGSTFPGTDFHGLYEGSNVAVYRPHRALLGAITRLLAGLHYVSALPVGRRGRTEMFALETDQLVSALDSVVQLPLCHSSMSFSASLRSSVIQLLYLIAPTVRVLDPGADLVAGQDHSDGVVARRGHGTGPGGRKGRDAINGERYPATVREDHPGVCKLGGRSVRVDADAGPFGQGFHA